MDSCLNGDVMETCHCVMDLSTLMAIAKRFVLHKWLFMRLMDKMIFFGV